MAEYKLTNNNVILRIGDNASIPTDPGNRDYKDYLKWVDQGNSPYPADDDFQITINKEMFAADNQDFVQVDIVAIQDGLTEVTIEVRGVPIVLPLTDGRASYQIKSSTPETVGLVGTDPAELSAFGWRLYAR